MPAWLGSGDGLLPGCRLLVPTGWQGQGGFLGPLVSRAPPSRPNRPKAPPPDTIALGIGFRSMTFGRDANIPPTAEIFPTQWAEARHLL